MHGNRTGRRIRTGALASLLVAAIVALPPGPGASAGEIAAQRPGGTFLDDSSIHEPAVEAIAAAGITRGCNPPFEFAFCPEEPVTRGQMAAFLRRALHLPAGAGDPFTDDDGTVFEADIEAIAAAGITYGCNPPANDRFCPTRVVTRAEMAAFLRRALDLPSGAGGTFGDDGESEFEADIEAIAAAGITYGCNPPAGDRYCPQQPVTRGQMASFLARALELPLPPPPPPLPALARGDSGPEVARLQAALTALRLYRGPADGIYGDRVATAVIAFHKLLGLERTDAWRSSDWALTGTGAAADPKPRPGEPDRIEVDIGRQLLFLIDGGEVAAIMPVSTGSGATYINDRGQLVRGGTPRGDMTLIMFRPGWLHTYLGSIYNPWNFTSAYAIHGFGSVPVYPASHGCVRVHLWDSDWLTGRLRVGLPIHIWDR